MLVAKIEEHANYYGLNFNKGKCVSMSFHGRGKPKFQNGEVIKEQEETMYLGGVISKHHDITKEVHGKLSSCFAVLNKLNVFWLNSSCPQKFKLDVFDAVVRSKLVYGLDVVHLPQYLLNKLDTFQLKGLRKILKMQTTYINRSNTNKTVLGNANAIRNPENIAGKFIKPFSVYVCAKQESLVKHTIRENDNEPLRQCTFEPASARPLGVKNRRVGRPRGNWAYGTLERMHVRYGYGNKRSFREPLNTACANLETEIRNKNI